MTDNPWRHTIIAHAIEVLAAMEPTPCYGRHPLRHPHIEALVEALCDAIDHRLEAIERPK